MQVMTDVQARDIAELFAEATLLRNVAAEAMGKAHALEEAARNLLASLEEIPNAGG